MLHRLCGPPSIPLSFSLATVLPRRGAYCVSFVTAGVKTRDNQHPTFTAWTTRVSNPVCSPRFRVSASVTVQMAAFATGVPPNIYEFHLYTGNSTTLSAYTRFTPSNSEQRLHPPYYRGCWHGVSRCFLWRYRQAPGLLDRRRFFPPDRGLRPEGLHPSRGVAGSGFPPLPKIPDCCLP
jgi:hypothetical protein